MPPPNFRFTHFDFDPAKYDSMLSAMNALDDDMLKGISGLSSVRAVRTLENRMTVMGVYDSKEALDAATETHRSVFADFAQYMTGEPVVRSGEVVGEADGQTPPDGIRYLRFTRALFDPSKFDAIKSYMDSQLQQLFKDVAGFSRLRVLRLEEDRILAAAGYTSKDAAEAARETAQVALAGLAEYMTEPPLVREGDVVWRYMR